MYFQNSQRQIIELNQEFSFIHALYERGHINPKRDTEANL